MKKKLLTAAILTVTALALVVASVLGTIAYLTASQAVSNTFTVGKVAIDMWETQVTAEGAAVGENKVKTNSYHLTPGQEYLKNPTIEITDVSGGSEMYLFVKSRNGIRNIEEGNQEGAADSARLSMRQQMEANGWVQLVTSGDGKDIVWVYGTRDAQGVIRATPVDKTYRQKRFNPTASTKGTVVMNEEYSVAGQIELCHYFKVDAGLTDLSEHNSSMVDFVAFAIQASGFEYTATNNQGNELTKAIWTAIKDAHENATAIVDAKNPYTSANVDPYAPIEKQ